MEKENISNDNYNNRHSSGVELGLGEGGEEKKHIYDSVFRCSSDIFFLGVSFIV